VISHIESDHPEIFYLPRSIAVCRRMTPDGRSLCEFDWTPLYPLGRIVSAENKMRMLAGKLAAEARADASDAERAFRAVSYLVANVEQTCEPMTTSDASSALFAGKADCLGIAKALKLLLDTMDIDNLIVNGTAKYGGESGRHVWNIVLMNGKYYHVDATYMLAANLGRKPPYVKRCFLCDDETMAQTHVWDRASVPACADASQCADACGDGAVRCNSLFEWKKGITEALTKRAETYDAVLNIRVDSEKEFARLMQTSLQSVIDRTHLCRWAELRFGPGMRVCARFLYPE
jgi:hypothetical protein